MRAGEDNGRIARMYSRYSRWRCLLVVVGSRPDKRAEFSRVVLSWNTHGLTLNPVSGGPSRQGAAQLASLEQTSSESRADEGLV